MESICQSCTNIETKCICSQYSIDYCDECGRNCDRVHSVKKNKTINEEADELTKVVLSYGTDISKLVANNLITLLNK